MWKSRDIPRPHRLTASKKQAFYDVLMFAVAFVLCVALCIFLVLHGR